MAFTEVPGLMGKVYVPEKESGQMRKHCCRDCFSCQMCSDDRCALCLDINPCFPLKSLDPTAVAKKEDSDV